MIDAALCSGLAAAGLAFVARALAPPRWLLRRPWSCDLCMGWWGSLLATAVQAWGAGVFDAPALAGWGVVHLAGVATAVLALKTVARLLPVG